MIGYWIFGAMVFLFPVAGYLLYLAIINNRPNPTMISGPWDFVGVLIATAGFWLVGGPIGLYAFHASWRPALIRDDVGSGFWSFLWMIPWIVYFVILIGVGLWVIRRRQPYSVIYNIDPRMLEGVFAQVFARLGLSGSRVGNRILIHAQAVSNGLQGMEVTADPADLALGDGAPRPTAVQAHTADSTGTKQPGALLAEVQLDPFPAMHHVTLRWWTSAAMIRPDLEAELGRTLAEIECGENPAAGWLLTISSCLFSAIFLCLVGFILLGMRR